jgi:hypothetical protein
LIFSGYRIEVEYHSCCRLGFHFHHKSSHKKKKFSLSDETIVTCFESSFSRFSLETVIFLQKLKTLKLDYFHQKIPKLKKNILFVFWLTRAAPPALSQQMVAKNTKNCF